MGAGSYEAGAGGAGEDPVADPSTPRAVTMPRAAKFDAASKAFPFDDDGRLQDAHPVDQEVALALWVVAGTLASAPELGHGLRSVRLDSARKKAVEDAVRLALAALLSRGDIEVLGIESASPQRGALAVEVTYRNLRADATKTRSAKTTARANVS